MKQRGLYYLILGVSALFVFLIARLPASVAYGWLAPTSFSLTGIEGTVWSGGARSIDAGGMTLGRTDWRMHIPSLFRAQTGYYVRTELDGLPIQGVAASSLNGNLHLRKLQADLPLSSVVTLLSQSGGLALPGSELFRGQLEVDIAHAHIVAGWPVQLDGKLAVRSLEMTVPMLTLGSYSALFDDQNALPIIGQLSDTEGPLDFAGTVSLNDDRCYELEWLVSAGPDAEPSIQQVLPWLGAPAAGGARSGTRSGCL